MPHIRHINSNSVSEAVAEEGNSPSVRRLEHVQLLHLDSAAEVEGAAPLTTGHLTSDVPGPGPDQGAGLLRAVRAWDDGGGVQGATQHRRIVDTDKIKGRIGGKWQPKRFEGGNCHKAQ